MDDLISRQAAIKAIENLQGCYNGFSDTYDKACIIGALEEVPSAQPEKVCIANITLSEEQLREAVEKAKNEVVRVLPSAQPEIIRCKDCKHRPVMVWSDVYDDFDVRAPEVDGEEDWRCPCLVEDDPYYSWSPNDNWFCGNGERRVTDEKKA